MRIGSLFSGIGGFELGLEWAGLGRTIWQVEIDPWCRSVLARWWPHAMRFDDVRMVGARELDPVDIICGGFPCQDVSDAGTQKGLDGARSGLWTQYRRVVGELLPRFVLVENVAALRRRGLDRVLGDLAGLGYDAEWHSIRASDVGAPHLRNRLFIIAWRSAVADANGDGQLRLGEGDERHDGRAHKPSGDDVDRRGADVSDAAGAKRERGTGPGAERGGLAKPADGARSSLARLVAGVSEPGMGGVPHGLPGRVARWPAGRGEEAHPWEPPRTAPSIDAARLRALGNAVVPQVAEVIGRRVKVIAEQQTKTVNAIAN